SDARVEAAATWYYSLEHSTDDYASFSRALENATRDYFIICPIIDMASAWAKRARGNVFMYHAPESYGRGRNPNYPYEFSRKVPTFATPWPDFVPRAGGENYKEFSALLPNRQGLKKADCSFWSKYISSLKASADGAKGGQSAESEEEELTAGSGLREDLLSLQEPGSKSYSK
ncbi:TG isoform 4, partial [Pongo abelii]